MKRFAFLKIVLFTFCSLTLIAGCVNIAGCSSIQHKGQHYSVVVGTLPTEDILPYWVAEVEGLFSDAGLDAEIVTFQSATELIAAVESGSVDLAMTDPMVAASIYASGVDVRIGWVTLGATPSQGKFGIMAGPGSAITSLDQLADVPIGVGSNTILEYVMDNLLQQAGVSKEHIVSEEIQKLPVRYQAMMEGNVAAAVLPASLLILGEANGATLIADDTKGDNLSQSVMIVRADWYEASEENQAAYQAMQEVWDEAVARINPDPEEYQLLLADRAQLSAEVVLIYPVNTYPQVQLPDNSTIDPILDWMLEKEYLKQPLTYDASTGAFAIQ